MIDYARAVGPLEEALERIDAMLEGLAEDHDAYRSTEELVGGILAVRDRLQAVREHVTLRARGANHFFRAGPARPPAPSLSRGVAGRADLPRRSRPFARPHQVERAGVLRAV